MTMLVPMWIPTLIYCLGAVVMLFFTWRNWKSADREYQRGYVAGQTDAMRKALYVNR